MHLEQLYGRQLQLPEELDNDELLMGWYWQRDWRPVRNASPTIRLHRQWENPADGSIEEDIWGWYPLGEMPVPLSDGTLLQERGGLLGAWTNQTGCENGPNGSNRQN